MPDGAARRRVWTLTAVLTVLAGALAANLVGEDPLDAPFVVPWPLLALLVAVAERYALHLRFRDQALTFTVSEIPVAVGLYFVAPLELVAARVLGGVATLLLAERQTPMKLAFNAAQYAAEATIAVTAFHLATGYVDPVGLAGVAAAVGSVGLGGLVGIVAVWWAIAALSGEGAGSTVEALVSGLPISVANAAVGMSLVVVAWLQPALFWLPLIPLAILLVAYRAYVAQRQHRAAFSALYETANEVHGETDLAAATTRLVEATRRLLRCDVAELLFQFDAASEMAHLATIGPGAAKEYRVGALDSMPGELRRLRAGDVDSVTTERSAARRASFGQTGLLVLQARSPLGRAGRLSRADADVLWSLSRLAVTTLERAELDEVKQAFLTAVSHELRTPLTMVFGGIETLQQRDEALPAAARRALLDRVGVQARRLGDLLSDLLDLDRLQRGVVEPRRTTVDLRDIAHEAVDAIDAGSHVVLVEGDPVVAELDPALVRRIVENLVANAVKYAPAGTRVWVRVGRDGTDATLTVSDEGPGIPRSQRQRVLQPFTRLDLHAASPGTGVGLALVDRFAALHGGSVRIDGGPGGGARITVTLPRSAGGVAAGSPAVGSAPVPPDMAGPRAQDVAGARAQDVAGPRPPEVAGPRLPEGAARDPSDAADTRRTGAP